MTEPFLRQLDLITPEQFAGHDVDVIGCGSLGSAILLAICKMGCGLHNHVRVFDGDRCERHNLATQWFPPAAARLGEMKVTAVGLVVEVMTGIRIDAVPLRFDGSAEVPLGSIVIVAVDSMEERWNLWRVFDRSPELALLIDARMGVEVLDISTYLPGVEPPSVYEATLCAPQDALVEPCTRRAVVDTGLGAAAFVGSILRGHVTGRGIPQRVTFDFRNFLIDVHPREGA